MYVHTVKITLPYHVTFILRFFYHENVTSIYNSNLTHIIHKLFSMNHKFITLEIQKLVNYINYNINVLTYTTALYHWKGWVKAFDIMTSY